MELEFLASYKTLRRVVPGQDPTLILQAYVKHKNRLCQEELSLLIVYYVLTMVH